MAFSSLAASRFALLSFLQGSVWVLANGQVPFTSLLFRPPAVTARFSNLLYLLIQLRCAAKAPKGCLHISPIKC